MGTLLLHPLVQLLVTAKAEIGTFRQQQAAKLGLVRAMAFTAVTGRQGSVPTAAAEQILLHVGVALEAQLILPTQGHSGQIAGMGVVTGKTIRFGKGLVIGSFGGWFHHLPVALPAQIGGCILEQGGLFGGVRPMAVSAAPIGHRLVLIGLEEFALGIGMAAVAETVHADLQHARQIGTVRIMTGAAQLCGEGLVHLRVFEFLAGIGMAVIAKLTAGFGQQFLLRGRVRPVAGDAAVPRRDGPMRGVYLRPFRVAVAADLIPLGHQQTALLGGVGIMAGETFPRPKRLVLFLAACSQVRRVMALVTELPSG